MEGLSVKERAKVQASLGAGKAKETKLLNGLKGETHTLSEEDLSVASTLFFKNCEDCTFVVDGRSIKFLVEGCKNCTITLNGHVTTEVVEFWRSDNCKFTINTVVKTLQLDLCKKLELTFTKKEYLGQLIWAGLHQFTLKIDDAPESTLKTGYEEMKKEIEDLNDQTDQFIVRFVDGALLQEAIVRLPNGFPTTEREAKEFDERAERNEKAAEEFIRKMIKETEKEKKEELAHDAEHKAEDKKDDDKKPSVEAQQEGEKGEDKPKDEKAEPASSKKEGEESKKKEEEEPKKTEAPKERKRPKPVFINM